MSGYIKCIFPRKAEITINNKHVLYALLPSKSAASDFYNLRSRLHDFELPGRLNYLTDCNFLYRVLYSIL
jgi:hypothetical protein